MLQMPVMQLEQRVEKELEENPALEEAKSDDDDDTGNISIEDYVSNESSGKSYNTFSSSRTSSNDFPTLSVKETLPEQLEMQLGYAGLDERHYLLALFLI